MQRTLLAVLILSCVALLPASGQSNCNIFNGSGCPTLGTVPGTSPPISWAGPPVFGTFETGSYTALLALRAWAAPFQQNATSLCAQVVPMVSSYIATGAPFNSLTGIKNYIASLVGTPPTGAGLSCLDFNLWVDPLFASSQYTANCGSSCYAASTQDTNTLATYDAVFTWLESAYPNVSIHLAPIPFTTTLATCGIARGYSSGYAYTETQAANCLVPLWAAIVSRYHVDYISVIHEMCGVLPIIFGSTGAPGGCAFSISDGNALIRALAAAVRANTQNAAIKLGAGSTSADDAGDTPSHSCVSPGTYSHWCNWIGTLMASSGANDVLDYLGVHVYPNQTGSPSAYFVTPPTAGGVLNANASMLANIPAGKLRVADESSGLRWGNGSGESATILGCGAAEWYNDGTYALWVAEVPGTWASVEGLAFFSVFDSERLIRLSTDINNTICSNTVGTYDSNLINVLASNGPMVSPEGRLYAAAQSWAESWQGFTTLAGSGGSANPTPNLCSPSLTGLPAPAGIPGVTIAAPPASCYQPPFPSPSSTVTVTSGSASDLQAKLAAAVCGEQIIIPANATYLSASPFVYGLQNGVQFGWQALQPYTVGQQFVDGNYYLQQVSTSGTSGSSSQPSWNETPTGTTADGSVVWTNEGLFPQHCPASNPVLVVSSNIGNLTPYQEIQQSASPANVPTLMTNANGGATLNITPAVSGVYFAGIEFTLGTSAINQYPVVSITPYAVQSYQIPQYVTFDRVLVHPRSDSTYVNGCISGALQCIQSGIQLNASNSTVMYSNIHDILSTTADAQAVSISGIPGPDLIVGNYLEASGENFFLTTNCSNQLTSTPTFTYGFLFPYGLSTCPPPSDVTIRLNHLQKQASWMNGAGSVTWAPSTNYLLTTRTTDGAGHIQQVTHSAGAGLSGSSTPSWNDTGGTTSDGNLTWTDKGTSPTPTCSPNWTSGCYSVKNLGEVKDGVRILEDSNIFDTTYANGQDTAVLVNCNISIYPPVQKCTDITMTNNVIQHVPNCFSLAGEGSVPWTASTAYTATSGGFFVELLDGNGNLERVTTAGTSGSALPSWPLTMGSTILDGSVVWTNEGPSPKGPRYLVYNNLCVDANALLWENVPVGVHGLYFSGQATSYLNLSHNTFLNQPSNYDYGANLPPQSMVNNTWQNNLVYGQLTTDSSPGSGGVAARFTNPTWGGNVFVGDWWPCPNSSCASTPVYPSGIKTSNSTATVSGQSCQYGSKAIPGCWLDDWGTVGLLDLTGCNAATDLPGCALSGSSPFHLGGSDGFDLGANIAAVLAAVASVQ